MKRISVESSNLRSVGYDESTETLEIEFSHGGVYQYFGVPKEVYEGLMSASSHGKYHAKYIKKRYSYQRV